MKNKFIKMVSLAWILTFVFTINLFAVAIDNPVASFSSSPNPAACNQLVVFDASSSSPADIAYDWDFGDGSTASGVNVSHAFSNFDTYTVTLTVTDDNTPAKTNTSTELINVYQGNRAPVGDAGGPYVIADGDALTLAATASDPDEACGDSVAGAIWDLNNDGSYDGVSGLNPTVPWSVIEPLGIPFNTPVRIRLRLTDELGLQSEVFSTLTITENRPPVGDAGGPYVIAMGGALTLVATASDPDGHAVARADWDVNDDGNIDASGFNPTVPWSVIEPLGIPFNTPVRIRLRLTDELGLQSEVFSTLTITENRPPVGDAGGPYVIAMGGALTLVATASDPDGHAVARADWDVNDDGNIDASGFNPTVPWSVIEPLGIPFNTPVRIRLRLTDELGLQSEVFSTLTINDTPSPTPTPIPQPTGEDSLCPTTDMEVSTDGITTTTVYVSNNEGVSCQSNTLQSAESVTVQTSELGATGSYNGDGVNQEVALHANGTVEIHTRVDNGTDEINNNIGSLFVGTQTSMGENGDVNLTAQVSTNVEVILTSHGDGTMSQTIRRTLDDGSVEESCIKINLPNAQMMLNSDGSVTITAEQNVESGVNGESKSAQLQITVSTDNEGTVMIEAVQTDLETGEQSNINTFAQGQSVPEGECLLIDQDQINQHNIISNQIRF